MGQRIQIDDRIEALEEEANELNRAKAHLIQRDEEIRLIPLSVNKLIPSKSPLLPSRLKIAARTKSLPSQLFSVDVLQTTWDTTSNLQKSSPSSRPGRSAGVTPHEFATPVTGNPSINTKTPSPIPYPTFLFSTADHATPPEEVRPTPKTRDPGCHRPWTEDFLDAPRGLSRATHTQTRTSTPSHTDPYPDSSSLHTSGNDDDDDSWTDQARRNKEVNRHPQTSRVEQGKSPKILVKLTPKLS